MGGPCASRIDFPGAEFTPEEAAASGTQGVPESGVELERAVQSRLDAGVRHTVPSPPAVVEPWDLHPWPGSARVARPPLLPDPRRS